MFVKYCYCIRYSNLDIHLVILRFLVLIHHVIVYTSLEGFSKIVYLKQDWGCKSFLGFLVLVLYCGNTLAKSMDLSRSILHSILSPKFSVSNRNIPDSQRSTRYGLSQDSGFQSFLFWRCPRFLDLFSMTAPHTLSKCKGISTPGSNQLSSSSINFFSLVLLGYMHNLNLMKFELPKR